MSTEDQKPKDLTPIETDLGSDLGEDFLFEEIEIEEDLEDMVSVDGGDILLTDLDDDLDEWEEYIDSHWIDFIHE